MKPSILKAIVVILVKYIGVSDCMLGAACQWNSSCNSDYSSAEYCREGICSCDSQIELSYKRYSLEPNCNVKSFASWSFSGACHEGACSLNKECIELPESFSVTHYFEGSKVCKCKEGYIRIDDVCYPAIHQKPTEQCYYNAGGTMKSCNISEKTICKNGQCQCFENFYANKTSGKCEPMSDYIQVHNLTSYRVRPGEYCAKKEHCIDGLECHKLKCSCPSACPYKKEEQICDCGPAVSDTSLVGPILVGIFVGILIMAFWTKMIRKTIARHGKKKRHQFDALPTDNNEGTSNANSYSLNPLNSHPAPTNMSSSVPPAKIGENLSPSPAVCPPQSTDNVFSTPQAPSPHSPLLPASYAEQPSGKIIPPHSGNPPTTDALPYSVNPTSLYYPSSSDALPYSINPTLVPYSSGFDAPLPESSWPSAPILNRGSPSAPFPDTSYPSASVPYPISPSAPLPYPSSPSAPPPYSSSSSAPLLYPSSPSAPLPDPSGPPPPYSINPSDVLSGGETLAPYGFNLQNSPASVPKP